MSRKQMAMIIPAAIGVVVVPFMFWYQTWFGRGLTNIEMEQYLGDNQHPRKVQHALIQISARVTQDDSSVRRWYPQVVALARHPSPEIRAMSAWVMGQDNTSEVFRRALVECLEDSDPMVRRNAALSLVRFGDARGRPELVKILEPVSPDFDQVWEALRGLYFVGQPEDLTGVERYQRGRTEMPDRVRQQAELTARAIRIRAERSPIR
jgi:hypothetical protein